MHFKQIQAGVALLACVSIVHAEKFPKDKRQVGNSGLISSEDDHDAAETGFSGNLGGHGKYFQYAHVPQKDHYEFGHRKGNEHHFKERHEKAHPHAGEFKTKVRWGDKHGGYGEHYWDYNHAGHHDGDGEESKAVEEYESYEPSASSKQPVNSKHQPELRPNSRGKRHHDDTNSNMKFIYDPIRGILTDEVSGRNFRLQPLN